MTGYWQNADVTVQVKQIAGPTTATYGIRLGSGPNGDRFDIDSTGKWSFRVCKGANCSYAVGVTANPVIHAGLGATNTLEVRVTTTHFDFYVNGTKVGQADDNTYLVTSGQVSLDSSDNIEVVYSSLTLATAR